MSKYPFVKQENIKDCGVTCLLMIIKYYKGYESLDYLRYISNTDKNGVTAYDLINTAKSIGFDAYAFKSSVDEVSVPCISHVIIDKKYKHFVVIYEVKENQILIADPAKKIKWISKDEFLKISSGIFILLNPIKKLKQAKEVSIIDFIYKVVLLNKKIILYTLIFSVLITIFTIIYSFHIQVAMKLLNKEQIYILMYIAINIYLIKLFSEFYRNKAVIILNKRIDKTLISTEYKKIINLPYEYFNNQTTGEIVSKINDLEIIKNVSTKVLITLLVDSIFAILTLTVMFFINFDLTIITLFLSFIFILISIFSSKHFSIKAYELYDSKVNLNSYLVESISLFQTIKGLSIASKIYDQFLDKHSHYLNKSMNIENYYNYYYFVKELIYNIFLIIIVSIAVINIQNDTMSIGYFITYNLLFVNFISPFKDLFELFVGIKEANIVLNRIIYFKEEVKNKIKINKGAISVENFNYKYKNQKEILKNTNLSVDGGSKLLITGKSGLGKSTLLKALKNYITVEKDKIFIDGVDINNVDTKDIAYLSQNENLFTDTILNNILISKNIDNEKLTKILEIVGLNEQVDYNLLLEENGKNISGGQRQRILIARMIVKNFKVYLFDESFSQLDPKSERIILKKLFSYLESKTIIVVSHRLDNADLFDKHYDIGEVI